MDHESAAAYTTKSPAEERVVQLFFFFFFQAEDGIRDYKVTGVQTCALPICRGMRNTMPWQLPPDSMPKTRPGFWGVPRLMVLHIFSARCQPKTRAVRRSQKSKSGRQISEP